MKITDGEKTITLEELAKLMCRDLFATNDEACWDDSYPAAAYCRHEHNGMIHWLRKLLKESQEGCK